MSSHLRTSGKFSRTLRHLPEASRYELVIALEQSIRAVQRTAVTLAPVYTGRLRGALTAQSAIGRSRKGLQVEFGLRTKALQKRAFYAPFVEYGTQAYSQGAFRFRGQGRNGLGRYRKIKVNIPARPAQPFLRPAIRINIPFWQKQVRAALRRALDKVSR
jgi:HK97 gp10 family phage protein